MKRERSTDLIRQMRNVLRESGTQVILSFTFRTVVGSTQVVAYYLEGR